MFCGTFNQQKKMIQKIWEKVKSAQNKNKKTTVKTAEENYVTVTTQ